MYKPYWLQLLNFIKTDKVGTPSERIDALLDTVFPKALESFDVFPEDLQVSFIYTLDDVLDMMKQQKPISKAFEYIKTFIDLCIRLLSTSPTFKRNDVEKEFRQVLLRAQMFIEYNTKES